MPLWAPQPTRSPGPPCANACASTTLASASPCKLSNNAASPSVAPTVGACRRDHHRCPASGPQADHCSAVPPFRTRDALGAERLPPTLRAIYRATNLGWGRATQHRHDVPLFYSLHAGRPHMLSTDAISVLVKNYGEGARTTCAEVPPRVHPHLFRHSRAMHLYQSGMPLPYIAEFLGHASVTTTEIYASADTEMLRKAIERADPGLADETPTWKNEESLRRLCGL